MYESFYGLRERPFNLTPDPRYLFQSEKHKDAFAHLLYGIKHHNGFVMLSGEIGTGKTTILRALLQQVDADADTDIAFVFNPCLSPLELLRKINEDFGIRSRGETIKDLVDELNTFLLERNLEGRHCVLVIDEAQNLTPSVLEHIRLLSNLETETQKLLQIFLVGQPELSEHLELPELRQLSQRITARYHLRPLNREETVQYIAFRLGVAEGLRKVNFTPGALRAVYRHTGGVPRLINSICDRALLIGFTRDTRTISGDIIEKAVREVRGERVRAPRRRVFRALAPTPSLVLAALVCAMTVSWTYEHFFAENLATRFEEMKTATPVAATGSGEAHFDLKAHAEAQRSWQEAKRTPLDLPKSALDGVDPASALNGGAIEILRLWNMALLSDYPQGEETESLFAFAAANGMTLAALTPTVDELFALDVPALVKLAGDARGFLTALVGVDDQNVKVTAGVGKVLTISRDEFARRYLGHAYVFWRDDDPQAALLKPGASGPEVKRLQARLKAAGLLSQEPSGTYDAATRAAVEEIQRRVGLSVDGLYGRNTRLVLEAWAPSAPTPSLSKGPRRPMLSDAAARAEVASVPKKLLASPLDIPVVDRAAPTEASDADPVAPAPSVESDVPEAATPAPAPTPEVSVPEAASPAPAPTAEVRVPEATLASSAPSVEAATSSAGGAAT